MIDNLELEYQVIGSFINDSSTHDYINKLKEDDFTDPACRKIFNAMQNMQSEEINIFSLYEKTNIPASQIAQITATIATTTTIEYDCKVLKDRSNRRKLKNKARKIFEMAKDKEKDISEIKNNALQEIHELEDVIDEEVITLRQAMLETSKELDDRYKEKDDKSLYMGIPRLDKFTVGLHKEELTTIGARPGVGKTILGMQIGLNIAKNNKKVLFTSLEMSVTQICERILSANTNVDSLRLRRGDIQDHEWEEIFNAANYYAIDNFLLDKTSRNIQHIRTKIRKHQPDLIIIDYLQLLQSVNREHSREREVAIISRDLKLMCLEFKIPIVILSQLNRNAEGKRPTLADIRESGAIEQDSDNVLFIHEPNDDEINKLIDKQVYPPTFFRKLEKDNQKLSQLIIEKQRNGPVGTIDVVKVPELMKFIEIGGDYE